MVQNLLCAVGLWTADTHLPTQSKRRGEERRGAAHVCQGEGDFNPVILDVGLDPVMADQQEPWVEEKPGCDEMCMTGDTINPDI